MGKKEQRGNLTTELNMCIYIIGICIMSTIHYTAKRVLKVPMNKPNNEVAFIVAVILLLLKSVIQFEYALEIVTLHNITCVFMYFILFLFF